MRILCKFTISSLKENKIRTLVTIIGIMLSATMICAVTTFVSSFFNFIIENTEYNSGKWQGKDTACKYSKYLEIKDSKEIDELDYAQLLGYSEVEGCQNEFKPYIFLMGATPGIEQMLPIHITSGRFPETPEEILLPEHLAANGKVEYNLHENITLDIGKRIYKFDTLYQETPCYIYDEFTNDEVFNGERLAVQYSKTYKVVGFYSRPSFEPITAPGYTAITIAEEEPNEECLYNLYFTMKRPENIKSFLAQHDMYQKNSDLLRNMGVTSNNSLRAMLNQFAGVMICLIMFGSVALIYNAFSISVSERTRQFGLLYSLGATKKQMHGMILFEALVVSVIGIPIGILVGMGGITVTLILIGNKFMSLGYQIEMEVCVSLKSILLAILVSLVTVLISAWVPASKATRITAIEAIRQKNDIVNRRKALKTPKIVFWLFGLSGMLANKQYIRSKNKYRATVVSLFMSIVLFVAASSYTDYLTKTTKVSQESPYDIILNYDAYKDYEINDSMDYCFDESNAKMISLQLINEISKCKNVEDIVSLDTIYNYAIIDKDCFSEHYLNKIEKIDVITQTPIITEDYIRSNYEYDAVDNILYQNKTDFRVNLCFVNDYEFNRLLKKYKLDRDQFINQERPLGLTVENSEDSKYIKNKFNRDNFTIECRDIAYNPYLSFERKYINDEGECIYVFYEYDETGINKSYKEISESEFYDIYILESGKIIDEELYYLDNYEEYGCVMIYPESLKDVVVPYKHLNSEYVVSYYIETKNHVLAEKEIEQELRNITSNYNIYNFKEEVENNSSTILIIEVFSYGFIILISMIAIANVFNTISTNVNLRRREFAMLKSIGMSKKHFNRMMNYECLLYGMRALIYGLPASVGVSYIIYKYVSEEYGVKFTVPWTAMLVAALSVFAVVFVTMIYSMRRINKENIVETLKKESI